MKQQFWKLLVLSFVLITSLNVYAHDADGGLPISASASNMWFVTCSDDGDGGVPIDLDVSLISYTKNGPMVSLQIITTDNPPKIFNIADPIGGDNLSSVQISTHSGKGHYILVNKATAGQIAYHFTYHCIGPYGHTGTDIQQIQ